MREILFKAKRKDNGEWVCWNLYGELCQLSGKRTRLAIKNGDTTHYYDYIYQVIQLIDKKTICQYTGLKDKKRKRIWENDLIKRYYADGEEMAISQIVFADYSLNLGWCIKDLKALGLYDDELLEVGLEKEETEDMKVIGNIFDNPELLGV